MADDFKAKLSFEIQNAKEIRADLERALEGVEIGSDADKQLRKLLEQAEDLNARLKQGREGFEDGLQGARRELQRIQKAAQGKGVGGLAKEYQRVEKSAQRATQTQHRSNLASMEALRIVQDSQYGIMGVANNVEQLSAGIGQAIQKTGSLGGALKATFMPLVSGPMALATIGTLVTVLATQWDTVADALDGVRQRLSGVTSEQLKAIRLQKELDSIREETANAEKPAGVLKQELETLRAELGVLERRADQSAGFGVAPGTARNTSSLYERISALTADIAAKEEEIITRKKEQVRAEEESLQYSAALRENALELQSIERAVLIAREQGKDELVKVGKAEKKTVEAQRERLQLLSDMEEAAALNANLTFDAARGLTAAAEAERATAQQAARMNDTLRTRTQLVRTLRAEQGRGGGAGSGKGDSIPGRVGVDPFSFNAKELSTDGTLDKNLDGAARSIAQTWIQAARRAAANQKLRQEIQAARSSAFFSAGAGDYGAQRANIRAQYGQQLAGVQADRASAQTEVDALRGVQEQFGLTSEQQSQLDRKLLLIQQHKEREKEIRARLNAEITANQRREGQMRRQAIQQTFGSIGQIMGDFAAAQDEESKKGFERRKKFLVGQAIMNTISTGIGIWESALTSSIPFPFNIAAATAASAATLTSLYAQVKKIRAMKPGGSGGGSGGAPSASFTQLSESKSEGRVAEFARRRGQERPRERRQREDMAGLRRDVQQLSRRVQDQRITYDDRTAADISTRGQKRVSATEFGV